MAKLNYYFFLVIIVSGFSVSAQNKTRSFLIEGTITKTIKQDLTSLKKYKTVSLDTMTVYNHAMTKIGSLRRVKGVLLKDVLLQVFDDKLPKTLSEYYIVCYGADGYKVVYSWNELFNTENGNHTMIVTQKNGVAATNDEDALELITPKDRVTARRQVKALTRIVIQKVN